MRRVRFLVMLVALGVLLAPMPARADPPAESALFALIIGSNASVDAELPALRYADDDAAGYLQLFRALGARTYLLTRFDESSRRVHSQAAAEALEPTRAQLTRAIALLADDVARAHARGVATAVYFVFAGHGSAKNGEGYITLEDARLTGRVLASDLVAKVAADRFHFVIDACDSYFLAYGRGAGGERRAFDGFETAGTLAQDPRVGLLLSTSSARESHEWEAFQAGVFSHEVRSGLYGAADADNDGQVTYAEIAAFVRQANAAIANEKFRPELHAKSPVASRTLLDLRRARGRRLEIDGAHAAHYYLEDARGVRLLDLHNAEGQSVVVLRGADHGLLYLHRVEDDREFSIPPARDVVAITELVSQAPRTASRGAAQDAFNQLFSLPFDASHVTRYESEPAPDPRPQGSQGSDAPTKPAAARTSVRTILSVTGLGLGAVGLGGGVALSVAAHGVADGRSAKDSQADVADRNDRIRTMNTAAVAAYAGGGVTLAAGLALLLWPDSQKRVSVSSGAHGVLFSFGDAF